MSITGRRHEVDQRAMQAARGVLDGAPLPDHVRRSIESAFGSANISRAQAQQAAASAASASASAGEPFATIVPVWQNSLSFTSSGQDG